MYKANKKERKKLMRLYNYTPQRIDVLEVASDKVRQGVSLDFFDALAVCDYQTRLKKYKRNGGKFGNKGGSRMQIDFKIKCSVCGSEMDVNTFMSTAHDNFTIKASCPKCQAEIHRLEIQANEDADQIFELEKKLKEGKHAR